MKKEQKPKKPTKISLEKDEVAFVVGKKSSRVLIPDSEISKKKVSYEVLAVTAIAMLYVDQNKSFIKIIDKQIDKMIKEVSLWQQSIK